VSSPTLELGDVWRVHPGQPPVEALRSVDLAIEPGELVAIVGPSGSGKTTLLQIMGTLDRPTRGLVRISGVETTGMTDRTLSGFRAIHLGFVFQQFFLVDGMSVLENVATGLLYRGVGAGARRRAAAAVLDRVGLGPRMSHPPARLSGGERQRAAIARAIVGRPSLVLADEPTGNLDSVSGEQVVALLRDLNRDGTTIAVVTHNHELAAAMQRQVVIRDGRIASDTRVAHDA
jgi:putative ABC transport system ATP-binding protein